MTKQTHQINVKVSKNDLNYIDAKAKKYGINRSALIKLLTLNGEVSVEMQHSLRKAEG